MNQSESVNFKEQMSDLYDLLHSQKGLMLNMASDEKKSLDERIKILRDALLSNEPTMFENEALQKLRFELLTFELKINSQIKNEQNNQTVIKLKEDFKDYLLCLFNLKMIECMLQVDLTNNIAQNYGNYTSELFAFKKEIEDKY